MKRKFTLRFSFILAALILSAETANAADLSFFTGKIEDKDTGDQSYGWQLEYAKRLQKYFQYSFSYLNEGHATVNHRDGVAAQLWTSLIGTGRRFDLQAGFGPYYYFDTHNAENQGKNVHGWGALVSVGGSWYNDTPWFLQIRTSWITTREADTLFTSLGIGYHLDSSSERKILENSGVREAAPKNELTLFFGDTIVNNPDRYGHYSYAESLEYRRSMWPHIEWSAGWLHENKNHLIERNGVVTQVWAATSCLADHIALGVGLGPYFAVDRKRNDDSDKIFASGIGTMTAAYHFGPYWTVRFSWSRIITDYDRDSDVIMLGVGRRF